MSLCAGCGDDLTDRASDRRSLYKSQAANALQAWKDCLQRLGKESEIGELLKDGDVMCRSCFSAFGRYYPLNKDVTSKIEKRLAARTPDSTSFSNTEASETSTSQSARKRPPPHLSSTPTRAKRLCHIDSSRRSHHHYTQSSPGVVVQVEYRSPRRYILTPSRKRLGRAVARKFNRSIVEECLANENIKSYLLKKLTQLLRKEIKKMCSDEVSSVLQNKSSKALSSFQWKALINELSVNAPLLLHVLQSCTVTKTPRQNRIGTIGICAAILLCFRYCHMNLVQRILSLVLYAGHSGKRVYKRLSRLNVVTSHKTATGLVSLIGTDHDALVKQWRDRLTSDLKDKEDTSHFALTTGSCMEESDNEETEEDEEEDGGEHNDESGPEWSSSESSASASSKDDMPASSDDSESEHLLDDLTVLQSCVEVPDEVDESDPVIADESGEDFVMPDQSGEDADESADEADEIKTYSLCGDNFDKMVKRRFMRYGEGNVSHHWFNSYASLDRIDLSKLAESLAPTCLPNPEQIAASLLPSFTDDKVLKKHFSIFVSRTLVTHMKYFTFGFNDVVQWHIPHQYSTQMSKKSIVVPLGVQCKNETKGDDMVDIMSHLHQYVPTVDHAPDMPSTQYKPSECVDFHRIFVGGDQLTAARARSAKKHMANALTPVQRLEGLVPMAEDWHTKAALLGVLWKLLYTTKSPSQHGTLYQMRNLINRRNVVKKPIDDFNACDDFFMTVLTSHILMAAMRFLHVESLDQIPPEDVIPDAESIWMQSKEERRELIDSVSYKIVEEFVTFQFCVGDKEMDVEPCAHSDDEGEEDKVQKYAKQLLSLGLFYWEYSDCIREGDGERLSRCFQYMLPMFINTGRKNYAIEAFHFLYQQKYQLSPRLATQLLYCRFINVHGQQGCNIAADLHMEHINAVGKGCIKGLGPNKTVDAIQRSAKALGTIVPVLQMYDSENAVPSTSGKHKRASVDKDVSILLSDLKEVSIFASIPGRHHKSFPDPVDALHKKSSMELKAWIVNHL